MKFTTSKEADNEKIAKDFLDNLSPKNGEATVVGLYGNLGAGKTTFTKYVAKYFGIEDTITSPTFVIEKIYELNDKKFTHLIHIDAYRIEKSSEMINLGWNKIIADPKNIIFVEWPEKIADIMPKHVKISFEHGKTEESREINLEI